MAINFDQGRWDKLKETYKLWWNGELERSIIPVVLTGGSSDRVKPNAPLLSQQTCNDLSVPAEEIIDRLDYELSTREYLGDAFPFVGMDVFGPGVVASFLGAKLDNSSGSVWFHPVEELPIKDIHFEYDSDNKWLLRIKDICTAAMEKWQGNVLVGMSDLGGAVDILSTFRPGEKLIFDFYDHPEEVKRLVNEIHDLWFKFYQEINEVLQPVNPGYSDWSGIYSSEPSYIFQCDFCYMIGPDMFKEFVKPELSDSFINLPRSFYHLDGPGELVHVDSLLSVDELDGIQWIPGAGNPGCTEWLDLYRKIRNAGKKLQIVEADFNDISQVVEQLGSCKGLQFKEFHYPVNKKQMVFKELAKFDIV